MNIDDLMKYATKLAVSDSRHGGEDLYKLASLCEDIFESERTGNVPSNDVKSEFQAAMKSFFHSNGMFRNVVEQFPTAKQLIQEM